MENAQFLERNYTVNSCYHRPDAGSCSTDDGVNFDDVAPNLLPRLQAPAAGAAKYTITVAYPTDGTCTLGQCFTLSAAPTGSMTGDPCGTLMLSHTGAQEADDYDGNGTDGYGTDADANDVAACWQR
jgi:type IV pilus assembly protein PilE